MKRFLIILLSLPLLVSAQTDTGFAKLKKTVDSIFQDASNKTQAAFKKYEDSQKPTPQDPIPVPNRAPIVEAGQDITIQLPANKVQLRGIASDVDGTIKGVAWSKKRGPPATIVTINSLGTEVNNLIEGLYAFELVVTDDKGAISTDEVEVTVKPAPVVSQPPPVAVVPERIINGQTVVVSGDVTITKKTTVEEGGRLVFDPSKSTTLHIKNVNLVIQGLLEMLPANSSIVHEISIEGVDESKFVGGGMMVLDSDIGLWVVGKGTVNLQGATKTAWTNASGSVQRGATSITVKSVAGWQIGDEITITPTGKPTGEGLNFDEATQSPIDPFFNQFERRKITRIEGTTVFFSEPLKFDHNLVFSTITATDGRISSKTWTAEVANLTRNIKIHGTEGGRSHIFISAHGSMDATTKHTIKYVEGYHLGPRKFQGRNRKELVNGRYGMHFHHSGYATKGTLVEGCAFHEMGNRTYVPHVSHGITFRSNVSFNSLEAAFWWDFSDRTHETTYDGNLVMAVRHNGVSEKSGITLVLGDRNVCVNNVAVYAHIGDTHGAGAYSWEPNSIGVWVFENNLAHSNHGGAFIWDNGPDNHFIKDFDTYNNQTACFLGAYGNIWTAFGGHHYNSPFVIKATSVNTFGVVLKDMFFDGAGQVDYPVQYETSAIRGNDHSTNKLINCVWRNFTKKAVSVLGQGEIKFVDIINPDIPDGKVFDFIDAANGMTVRYQPKSGQPWQSVKGGSQSNVGQFAAPVWGNGTGLKGEYYLGKNFDKFLFSRIDPALTFQTWREGVDNLIPAGSLFSVRWTGFIEPQYSEAHTFNVFFTGGYKLWIDDVLVAEEWFMGEKRKRPVINLTQGRKVKVKIEMFTQLGQGAVGAQLYWKSPSMKYEQVIPQSQLYSN